LGYVHWVNLASFHWAVFWIFIGPFFRFSLGHFADFHWAVFQVLIGPLMEFLLGRLSNSYWTTYWILIGPFFGFLLGHLLSPYWVICRVLIAAICWALIGPFVGICSPTCHAFIGLKLFSWFGQNSCRYTIVVDKLLFVLLLLASTFS